MPMKINEEQNSQGTRTFLSCLEVYMQEIGIKFFLLVLLPTIWIFDLHAVRSKRWFAHSSLVFSEHSEFVSAILNEVGNIDHVCQAGCQVDAVPVFCSMLTFIHPVGLDPSTTIRFGFVPFQADKVATHLSNLGQAWSVGGI